ncbi:uracil DNA glycosylase superfamily protein [Aspergillus clavatus NRRL 1]|uniref:Uracil DNA glycosylase superfamily protein n=1 Tax=Aspergillus clavatus (strain ATCC 1007 / CBS 513.65 / DSM 816 / NCTC 3887 / NRRL 1 / QM 1276 / 107) TaxID=344612 RepID=A1CUH3_ASPCL|nr:uracil DNA glycosylase superfamily protein [Aspergillus clavatus NRRL 1]EAW06960.1 uracil DNA glycosylase superfamily protein [Aspergillus clavatus NRRL 1]
MSPLAAPELQDIHREQQHDADDNDVPVNRMTSFNGRLNRYFHTTKASALSNEPTTKAASSSAPDLQDTIKRKTESQLEVVSSDALNASTPLSKRRKALRPRIPTPNPTTPDLPQRITRSRSASSLPTASSPSIPQSPRRGRGARKPSTPTTSITPASPTSLLRDTIPPNLTLLLVGVNPGILTGTTGFAYAHPSNLFWKLLHWSGITPIRHPPCDTYRLPELYNIGNTNIVERPTRDASMLSRAEMLAGVPVLEAKVAAQRPEAVCLVGKSIWEAVWRARKGRAICKEEFRYGWQEEGENMGRGNGWEGARVFVATTTSGLAAGMSTAEKQAVWDELGQWVVERREAARALQSQLPGQTTDLIAP